MRPARPAFSRASASISSAAITRNDSTSDGSSPFHFRANRCFWISRGVRREGMSGPPGLIREGGRQEQAFQEHFDEEDGEDHEDRGEVDPAEIGRASCREKREGYSG